MSEGKLYTIYTCIGYTTTWRLVWDVHKVTYKNQFLIGWFTIHHLGGGYLVIAINYSKNNYNY